MIVPVHLLAFRDGEIREVEIPDSQWNSTDYSGIDHLELVWWHGQNDNQPKDQPSVSMGDVAELWGKWYLCCSVGWKELSKEQYEEYCKLPRIQRSMGQLYDALTAKDSIAGA